MIKFKEAKEFITQKQLEEIPKHFTYHSLVHILIVYESCKVLAEGEGITGIDLQLLLTAALFMIRVLLLAPKIMKKHLVSLHVSIYHNLITPMNR